MLVFGCWAGKKCFCTKKVHVKMIWKHVLYIFLVLLNGPVQYSLFCLTDRYQNVCVWFMARNCRFPKVGTPCCQRGNHRLPLQGTADSQRLELLVPNLGTKGYHGKELPVPRPWNLRFPTWEPEVPIARNCRFPKLEFMFSKLSNYHCKELPVAKAWNSWFQTWKGIRYQWTDLLIPKR